MAEMTELIEMIFDFVGRYFVLECFIKQVHFFFEVLFSPQGGGAFGGEIRGRRRRHGAGTGPPGTARGWHGVGSGLAAVGTGNRH